MSDLRVKFIKNTSLVDEFSFTEGGALGLGGNNFGTSGQVLTSQGSGSAPTWTTPSSSGVSVQVITSTGTYTPTSGKTNFLVYCFGAGGGGSASRNDNPSWGGGGGGCAWRVYTSAEMGTSASVTIGAGGAGGTGAGAPLSIYNTNVYTAHGQNGGDSEFNPNGTQTGSVTLTGGGGGGAIYAEPNYTSLVPSSYGYGGSSSGGHVNWKGNPGYNPVGNGGPGGAGLMFGIGRGGNGVRGNTVTTTRAGTYYIFTAGGSGTNGGVVVFEY